MEKFVYLLVLISSLIQVACSGVAGPVQVERDSFYRLTVAVELLGSFYESDGSLPDASMAIFRGQEFDALATCADSPKCSAEVVEIEVTGTDLIDSLLVVVVVEDDLGEDGTVELVTEERLPPVLELTERPTCVFGTRANICVFIEEY